MMMMMMMMVMIMGYQADAIPCWHVSLPIPRPPKPRRQSFTHAQESDLLQVSS
jgi:hypothetical protein